MFVHKSFFFWKDGCRCPRPVAEMFFRHGALLPKPGILLRLPGSRTAHGETREEGQKKISPALHGEIYPEEASARRRVTQVFNRGPWTTAPRVE